MTAGGGQGRSISPVVGTVLLVAVVLLLATSGTALFFSLTDRTDSQPSVVMESEQTDGYTHKLLHEGGEQLNGDRLEFRGAADPAAAAGMNLSSGDSLTVYPVEEEIQVIWVSEYDESYTLTTVSVEDTLPEPDENCDWVETETNGGVDPIKIDNIVVNCDVGTEEQVEIQNGGVVIGESTSDLKDLDADDAEVYGDVTVEKVLNLQDGLIAGSATSQTSDVKIDNGSIGGSIEAEKVAEVTGGSTIEGDVESKTKDVKILDDSVVEGSVTGGGTVKVQDSEIEGDVYVDSSNFDCTNSIINGQNCSSYSPKDPSNW